MTKTVNYTKAGPLSSSALSYFWYDDKTRELYVKFSNSSRIAGYRNVPGVTVQDFLSAYSKGAFYSSSIKGRFPTVSSDVAFVQSEQPIHLSVVHDDQEAFSVKKKRSYKVYALVEISEDYLADDVDDAVAAFYDDHGSDAKVSKVEVSFD